MTNAAQLAQLSPDERRALLTQLLHERASATPSAHPLAYGQRSLWFLHQLDPGSAAYNIAVGLRLRSPVDALSLRRVFQTWLDRHAMLRSAYRLCGDEPALEVQDYRAVCFVETDVAGYTEAELREQALAAYRRPFDLEHGPLLRVQLFHRAAADHVLLITVHHIAADGWSLGLLLNEFRRLYEADLRGAPLRLPPPIASYSDFVKWQLEMLATADGGRLRDYWRQQLAGDLPVLNLPTDRPRPPIRSARGATQEFSIGPERVTPLKRLAKSTHATLYTVLLAAFQVLLHRLTAQDDLLIGAPMAGRSRAEFEGTVGYFVSPVVLRANLAGRPTFTAVIEQARQTVLAALDHQDYPFPLLVEQLQPRRDPSRSPVFDVLFNMQNVQRLGAAADFLIPHNARSSAQIGDLVLEPYPLPQEEGQFDLALDFYETDDTLLGALRYSTELFDAATVAQLQERYRAVLADMVAHPEQRIAAWPLCAEATPRRALADREDLEV